MSGTPVTGVTFGDLASAQRRSRRVAIGVFDGVHLGHRRVIEGSDTVLTFAPHPLSVLRPGSEPPLVCSEARRIELIGALGPSEIIVARFDADLAKLSAQQFIDEILIERLGADAVSIGANFRFGAGAGGDADLLRAQDAFETRVEPLVELDGEIVSSSRIRSLLEAGDVAAANRCLGAPFAIEGEVIHGEKRGREIGVPTANLLPPAGIVMPANGVYAGFADGHPAAINIGVRPTFDSSLGLLIEAHLIGFEGDLYGQRIRVELIERLRDEERFDTIDALLDQMARDIVSAEVLCASFISP